MYTPIIPIIFIFIVCAFITQLGIFNLCFSVKNKKQRIAKVCMVIITMLIVMAACMFAYFAELSPSC